MLSALYYPNTRITNGDFLKNCLLLWDQVEYIIPHPGFQLPPQTRDIDEALELIAKPHLPSKAEKLEAHKAILEIAEKEERPKWLFFDVADRVDEFSMFSGKLLSETWRALERSKLARPTISEGFNAFATKKSLGLTVMAILADSCAGTQKALTTDRAESHSALTRWITLTKGGEFKAGAYKKDAEDYKRLVSISLKVIDSRRFKLRNLISLRQREEREGGHSLRDLRHRYVTKINEYTDKLATQARTQGDKAEIERAFEQEMKDDLKALQSELRAHGKKTLLSKEIAVAVVASAGIIVEPVVSSVLGVGALLKLKVEYREGRNKVLRNHSVSWLYEPSKPIHLY